MTDSNKAVLIAILIVAIGAATGIILTHGWEDSPRRLHADVTKGQHKQQLVDTSPLETAQQLAALAVTPWEKQYADDALRLADHSVDLAFTAGLADAVENPPAITPETQEILARIKDVQARVNADQDAVTKLTAEVAKAPEAQKALAQDKLEIAQAQLGLDKDELDDDHEDLVRAGGDKRALIQKQLDQHEATETHATAPAASAGGAAPAGGASGAAQAIANPAGALAGGSAAAPAAATDSAESGNPKSLWKQIEAVMSMTAKEDLLAQARTNALARIDGLQNDHEALEKLLTQEKSEKKIVRRHAKAQKPSASRGAAGASAAKAGGEGSASAQSTTSSSAIPSAASTKSSAETREEKEEHETSVQTADELSKVEFIQHLNSDQKMLALYDKRIADEESLAKTYADWSTLVVARHHAFVHAIFINALWIAMIALFVFVSNLLLQKAFDKVDLERRQAATMKALFLVITQLIGAVLILLVILGVPNNFGTVAALAGAGITVAMKDFIVGFFGWFILMGKNGIHPGDWVEINGVGGEVLELGLLHTVLLETGSWADAGHPTGRKVTFVNSYAIEGHYFNFSTSGQWLWDEMEIQVPASKDPFKTSEAIEKLAADATKGNAGEAKAEWERATPGYAKSGFTAEPAMSVRPAGGGVEVKLRYLTRANDRHETRAKLYREIVDLLHADGDGGGSVAVKPAPSPAPVPAT
jgi:small-conductance mechanosensitive channel